MADIESIKNDLSMNRGAPRTPCLKWRSTVFLTGELDAPHNAKSLAHIKTEK